MQVDFYQLGRTPLARVLAQIAARVVADGGRLLVVADGALAAELDAGLWEGEDSFLPHGRATANDPGADQPVLIAADLAAPANGARYVAIADGVWRDDALAFERAFHFFGEHTLEAARAAWRGLGRDGVMRAFWRRDEEGWTKVA